ncbi:uncharacterized protein SS50377_28835 [Spironucleus salmonicida]|uniref:Uncharacterized protein n=1 Tax=Spironucleus salmonicida TaxID=348837 RepID=V6LRJ2_9EUKA|nr:hypothetical protein SS50377_28835 [Spironucleus salmonicida]|eukprot:EST46316.1 Hypothetical protein SS50377_13703 [Spironucleus salmonicida]
MALCRKYATPLDTEALCTTRSHNEYHKNSITQIPKPQSVLPWRFSAYTTSCDVTVLAYTEITSAVTNSTIIQFCFSMIIDYFQLMDCKVMKQNIIKL